MQISPKEELISSTISSLSNHHLPIAPYTKLGFTSLHTVNKNKPYIPYSDCVLKHILHSLDLTNQEKLFYLIADSLSLISGQNATKKRSAALPATKWAKNLNCSKNEIFTMQKSLEAKGYFIVIRDKNEFGKNQRNIIIPSLPDTVFHYLSKALNRSNNELTDNSPITSLTSSLAFPHCLNIEKNKIEENKRVYLDKTKLFIRLNYQLLLLIASSDQLTSFAKVLWLDFYTKCYKYHMKLKNTDTGNDNNNFACTTSYKELETKYSCTKATLSKTMNVLEKLGFIDKKRFHVKNDNKDDNLHDKSLWNVTLSLPKELALNILNLKPRLEYAYQANSKPNISSTDPYVANCGQLLNKDIKSNTKDSDSIDSRKSFFEKTNISSPKNLSELSISYKNSLEKKTKEILLEKEQKIVSSKTTPPIINIQKSILKTETSNNLEEGKLKAIEEISETVRKEQEKTLLLNQVNEQNNEQEQINTTNGVINTMAEMPVTSTTNLPNNSSSYNKSLSCNKQSTQDKSLKSFYPLTKEQVDKLNQLSNREFSNNFANQLLLKLYIRDPNKTFASTNHMISYMSKAFRYEKHQAPMVNHETFRFIANVSDPESVEMRQKEKYLSEVEYSIDTSYCSQLRKKIAGMFETKLAYQILTEGEFDYHATNDQEISQALEIKNDFYQNLELSEENNITKFGHVPNYSTCFVDSSLSLTSKHDIANIDYDNQLSTNVTENDQMKSSIVTIENDDINNNIPTRELYGLSLKSLPARQFTNITLANTCTVKLPRDLTLTNYQQQNLEKAISTVYGYVKIVYQQLPAIYKKLGSSRLPDEIFLAELDQNSVWYKIRKKLIDNFDEYIDKAWFSKLRAEEDAITQKLTLIAPTNFLRDWINAKYSSFIKDIAKKLDYQFVELITKKQSLCNVI